MESREGGWDLESPRFPVAFSPQVHCISTEFTPRKKGGEKGVSFRLRIDTFKPSDKELAPEHLHSAGCLIKVFKVPAAPGPLPLPLRAVTLPLWLCGFWPCFAVDAQPVVPVSGTVSFSAHGGLGLAPFLDPLL